ncbi:glycoside hydrolase family 13 protein [Brachybacterium rhamnosum]|uniref:Glycoside hydrolase family 13 protein n=1 Tax=Brachybacterium rhamnosum TaxID=173361 RepID=A0ABW4Q100_9MICO|nr:glycoside hydrolase family 13 protein [Brachybacterium sp. SGAir0954]QCR53900.1 alpha-amylase [Brachybacterium sp. SGAir0954]
MTLPATGPSAPATDPTWWRQAAVYQIYPRSFADANGDGIGDLRGVTSRVPYLSALGVDAVWLSPFYPSALADGGYDVDDPRGVDPRIGTLEDFDAMVAALHESGIRVVVDIVPNHSSDRHAWFRAALAAGPGSPERERYIFRDGLGEHGELPPADWTSAFGGPAWTRVEDGQWYLHTFATEQPDYNWAHPEVREDFLTTLRFWADRGVDGFRVDVANSLAKDLPEVLPSAAELSAMPKDGTHPLWDRDEVHEIYAEWRRVFDEYDPPRTAVAEAWVDSPERRARYASPEGLGQAFNFDLLVADPEAGAFRRIITANLEQSALSGSSSTWVLSNHDVVRHATRYGLPPLEGRREKQGTAWLAEGGPEKGIDRERGLRLARAATLVELALPGSAYLFQGEELGLHEVAEIPDADRQDPAFFRTTPEDRGFDGVGRDGCRVPLPWTREGSSFGFGEGGAHLPQPAWFGGSSVQAEDGVPGSTLELYREALRLRRELQGAEELSWAEGIDGGDVLAFERPGGWLTVANLGAAGTTLPAGELLLASGPLEAAADGAAVLPAGTTAWIRR